MFDLHLGAQLHVSSNTFLEGFFITGKAGQGRSTTLEQIVLELIRNKQSGLFVDPYGSMSKNIQSLIQSPEAKTHVALLDLDKDQTEIENQLRLGKFVFAAAKRLEDGFWETSRKGTGFLEKVVPELQADQWLIVDDAFDFLKDDFLNYCLNLGKKGIYLVFSDSSFNTLSKSERHQFAQAISNYVIYKPQNIDAVMLAEERPLIDPERVKSIKQYHFQALLGEHLEYSASLWPLEGV